MRTAGRRHGTDDRALVANVANFRRAAEAHTVAEHPVRSEGQAHLAIADLLIRSAGTLVDTLTTERTSSERT
ncbi:hypothetical protein SAMN04489732_11271 [Amycolatopsis saalfeldensis]|uniref:Uncharacterized protein n=1 Tax=Amycolatopsis saalfeldensis TaxID=394193 RepID=A0A1H8Y8U3_9PSEU|nr:hypothetical protein SAMN04489732_11271 [Amycolatopsis saalfeldensis]